MKDLMHEEIPKEEPSPKLLKIWKSEIVYLEDPRAQTYLSKDEKNFLRSCKDFVNSKTFLTLPMSKKLRLLYNREVWRCG